MIIDNYNLRIQSTISNFTDLFYLNSNIVGFARGNKMVNGMNTNMPALKIYVEKKLSEISIPTIYRIPKYINGVLTDVEELKEQKFFRKEKRPAMAGDSIGNAAYIEQGTITYAVTERRTFKKLMILACNHVIGGNEDYRVIQPGRAGGGEPPTGQSGMDKSFIGFIERIPNLKIVKTREEVKKDTSNEIDAAVAYVGERKDESARKLLSTYIRSNEGNPLSVKGTVKKDTLKIGTPVWCVGAVSGLIKGKIKTVNHSGFIKRGGEFIGFIDQIQVDMKCKLGDSGALGVIDDGSNKAFGMLVGGDSDTAMFTPIDTVLDILQVELITDKY